MRRLLAPAILAGLIGAWAAPARAAEAEMVGPDASEAPAVPEPDQDAPVAPAASPASPQPAETGSIEHTSPAGEPPAASAAAGPPPAESGVGRAIRDIIAAEIAAQPPPPEVPEGQPKPQKGAEERDRDAMAAFYEARPAAPIWVTETGLNDKARAVIAEIGRIGDWGLPADGFDLPEAGKGASAALPQDDLVKLEMAMSRAVLRYHLLARGGAIYDAPKTVSSYLDRRPSLRDRKKVLEDIAAADDAASYLVGMHPKHAEFMRLHEAWLEARKGRSKGKVSAEALLANMQQWRWMPEDLGETHVWLNVPEYLVRIVDKGEAIFTERATTGLINKQTPIFSDSMERVTFKPKWRVPDSIKVKEVWPSLLRGGGMMRQHGLIMLDRDEREVDWRRIDWSKADMNDYTLWQPPGRLNQLGIVRFSFPSKHRVYMHDTPDKHMFAWSRRAVSHGCMRIRNPLEMATVILGRDKGWDREKIDELAKHGPEHNIVELDRHIPVHITYFTVRIGEDGRVQTFADIYGHEKRVRQALSGQWERIAKGGDHLAPLDQSRVPRVAQSAPGRTRALRQPRTLTELMFGGF